MSKVISFFSLKGGVGKTTSCANIAIALGKANAKILLIDFDANGNLTSNFPKTKYHDGIKKIFEKQNARNIINKEVANNIDLISCSVDSSFLIINDWKTEYEEKFVQALDTYKTMYDLIFIDLSASWNSLNKMILSHSDSIIWPIVCTPFAVESINVTLNAIRSIQLENNPNLKIEGVFINIFDKRTTNSMLLYSEIAKIFGDNLYDTIIPQDSYIGKLQKEHKLIVQSASWKPAAIAFCELAKEIIK
ncbi:MAG: ParA family protein [Mycoplasma sp.]